MDQGKILSVFRQIQPRAIFFHGRLKEMAGESWLNEAARRLQIPLERIMASNPETQRPVFYDYVRYGMTVEGLNLAGHYRRDHPPAPNSLDAIVLDAMARSSFRIFVLDRSIADFGFEANEMGQNFLLADPRARNSEKIGIPMMGWQMVFSSFRISQGVYIPVKKEMFTAILKTLKNNDFECAGRWGSGSDGIPSELFIKAFFQKKDYECFPLAVDTDPQSLVPWRIEEQKEREGCAEGGPVSRNRPCPCGSGMKYKHCCGPRKRLNVGAPTRNALAFHQGG